MGVNKISQNIKDIKDPEIRKNIWNEINLYFQNILTFDQLSFDAKRVLVEGGEVDEKQE
jgi:hypothetical protein